MLLATRTWCAAWLLALGLPTLALAQLEDQVYTSGGAPTRGTITAMSPAEVTIDTTGGSRVIAVNEIRKIQFGGEPGELRTARDRVGSGQLEDALDNLNKLNPADLQRDVIRQDVEFYKAYCQGKLALTGGGDKATAVRQMLDFASKNSGSYHFFESAELLGDLALALGSYDNAVKYYGSLARAPWPEYQMKSAVLEAAALRAQQNFSGALTKYDQVLGMGLDTAEATNQKLLAQVGKAYCLAETGQPDAGIKLVEAVIAANDPQQSPVLFGRAYNALGAGYRKLGQTKDALLAYLHTDLMFYQEPDTHAEALYYLSDLWAASNRSDRAVRARSLLKDKYSGSLWAKQ
ncbi:MAG: hypothetical protein J5I93_01190 [Pirellulaceae bacterium]|nr:hypothetical protein [Pirellulaceae bacterium]